MAWTNPITWTATVVSVAQMNQQIRDNENFLNTAHAVAVNKSATQNAATGTATAVTFNGEDWDSDGYHDNVTNNTRLTVPAALAGFYIMGGQIDFATSAAGNLRAARIDLNGTTTIVSASEGPQTGNPTKLNPSRGWYLNVGDYIEILGTQDSGGALAMNATCIFWMARLGV